EQATVTSFPGTKAVAKKANVAFTCKGVAGGHKVTGVIHSNTDTRPVYSPVLGIVKSASTANATVGDQITYTLQIANTGNIGAATVITDNIPAGSSYVPGSFTVNGTPAAGNPATGISIGTVPAGGSTTVQFQVQVNSLPSPPQLVDQATAAYTFLVPDGRTLAGNAASNTLTIPVALPNVAVVKSAGFTDAAVGDILLYTSVISNNGLAPVTNVVLSDPVPAGSSFVPGSVSVAGAARPSADPATGITVGTVAAGTSVTFTFQVNVTSVPPSAQLSNRSSASYSSGAFTGISQSNTTVTPVYQPVTTIVKSANPASATVVGQLLYTLWVQNPAHPAAAVVLRDNVPPASAFDAATATVNGVAPPPLPPPVGSALDPVVPGPA
ncbi:hypothetical protein AMQ83_09450, partial [Paenibacillus riograndensis]